MESVLGLWEQIQSMGQKIVGGYGEVGTPKTAVKSSISLNCMQSVMQNSDTQGLQIINYNNQTFSKEVFRKTCRVYIP